MIPTEARDAVGLEDVFFSTTDDRGVIMEANQVFVRIARLPREELIGFPHNVIRHPAMPSGMFRIIWRMLLAGEPTSAYILNRAGDGSAYWAVATLAPCTTGFLSVRTRPMRTDLLDILEEIYADVRPQEETARATGRTAAEAAEIGEELILKHFAVHGFESYRAFIHAALPAEVDARLAVRADLPTRPEAQGTLRELLGAATVIEGRARALLHDLHDFKRDATRLTNRIDAAETEVRTLADALQSARVTVEAAADSGPLVVKAGAPLNDRCQRVDETLRGVAARVREVAENRTVLRFSAALSALQAEAMARYAVGWIDGVELEADYDTALRALALALEAGLGTIALELDENLSRSEAARSEIESSGSALRVLQLGLASWRRLVDQIELGEAAATSLPRLDRALAATTEQITALGSRAEAFADSSVSFDRTVVDVELARALALLNPTR